MTNIQNVVHTVNKVSIFLERLVVYYFYGKTSRFTVWANGKQYFSCRRFVVMFVVRAAKAVEMAMKNEFVDVSFDKVITLG